MLHNLKPANGEASAQLRLALELTTAARETTQNQALTLTLTLTLTPNQAARHAVERALWESKAGAAEGEAARVQARYEALSREASLQNRPPLECPRFLRIAFGGCPGGLRV
jgi:hypothetical protein